MKTFLAVFIVMGIGLGPGVWAARKKRQGDQGGRLWLGQAVVFVMSVGWVVALVFIIKAVW